MFDDTWRISSCPSSPLPSAIARTPLRLTCTGTEWVTSVINNAREEPLLTSTICPIKPSASIRGWPTNTPSLSPLSRTSCSRSGSGDTPISSATSTSSRSSALEFSNFRSRTFSPCSDAICCDRPCRIRFSRRSRSFSSSSWVLDCVCAPVHSLNRAGKLAAQKIGDASVSSTARPV